LIYWHGTVFCLSVCLSVALYNPKSPVGTNSFACMPCKEAQHKDDLET